MYYKGSQFVHDPWSLLTQNATQEEKNLQKNPAIMQPSGHIGKAEVSGVWNATLFVLRYQWLHSPEWSAEQDPFS